jgi:aspartate aminotransferase-like enzyme
VQSNTLSPAPTPLFDILPSEPLLMMGAGPVPLPAEVARANGIVINHVGATMAQVLRQVKDMARHVFQSADARVLGVAGPGSAAMEMAICNLVSPGDRVLSLRTGYFSDRLEEMAHRAGGAVETLSFDPSESDPARTVIETLQRGGYDAITLVHGETSSTVVNRHVEAICRGARRLGCLSIVDAVCTLSTMPLPMDAWDIDVLITGGQKGLSSIPGVSLLAFSTPAWQRIERRVKPPAQWCLDARLADRFWNQGQYHYTAPVSGILALHEALRLVCHETLPARFARHRDCSEALQAGIEAMGLQLYTPQAWRLNSVVGVHVPEGVSGDALRARLSGVHRVEISGSFGAPIVRIGQMGEQCREAHLFRTLHALGESCRALGAQVSVPAGMAALEQRLSRVAEGGEANGQ